MHTKKSQAALLWGIVVIFWFTQYIYIPFQTPFLMAQGVTSAFVGTIIGAYGISQAVLRFPIGIAADSIGRHKYFICIGVLCAGLASLIRIYAPTGPGFLVANLLSGTASATWASFMVQYTHYFPANESQNATSKIVMANNSGILMAFIVGSLFYKKIGMNYICLLSVLGSLLGLIPAFLIKNECTFEADSQRPSVRELISVCTNRRLLIFCFLGFVQQGIQMTTTMSFTTKILEDMGASSFLLGLSSIVYMISAVSFSWLASTRICTKRGPRFWIPTVCVIIAAYCILVPMVPSIWMIFLLQILPGMSTGILFSYATSEAMKEIPQEKHSSAMGFFQAYYGVGMTVLPVLTGAISGHFSMQAAYLVLAVVAIMGCLLSLWYYKRHPENV